VVKVNIVVIVEDEMVIAWEAVVVLQWFNSTTSSGSSNTTSGVVVPIVGTIRTTSSGSSSPYPLELKEALDKRTFILMWSFKIPYKVSHKNDPKNTFLFNKHWVIWDSYKCNNIMSLKCY